MKKFLLNCLLLLIAQPAFAVGIYGTAAKLISLKNINNSTNIYVKNYYNQSILLYKANFIYSGGNTAGSDQYDNILYVIFNCTHQKICVRFFNRKNNALSKVYDDFVAANTDEGKQIVANYDRKNNKIIIETMFEPCKKPTIYPLTIYPDSIFGGKTDFYPHSKLRIYYAAPITGNDAIKVFHIDYARIIARCKTGKG